MVCIKCGTSFNGYFVYEKIHLHAIQALKWTEFTKFLSILNHKVTKSAFKSFIFFLKFSFMSLPRLFSSNETGQSVGGRKRESPEKNHLAHPQAELGLSHAFKSVHDLHNFIFFYIYMLYCLCPTLYCPRKKKNIKILGMQVVKEIQNSIKNASKCNQV